MKCIACGAEITFSPSDRVLKCSYCGSQFEASDYLQKIRAAKETQEIKEEVIGPQIVTKSYICTQCGAKLLTFDDTAITFCSYCDSSNIIESELYKGEAPEYVIPFKITREECEKIYKKEIRKHILAPREMMDDVVIKKFRGIYMPYGVYKAVHSGEATNFGEKYSHRMGNYVYYNQYNIRSTVEAEYEGMAYDLSSSFYDKFAQAIGPFDFREAETFNINYLSGFYADSRDVKKDVYEMDAKQIIGPDTQKELLKHKVFRKYGCAYPTLKYDIQDKKIAYYPVYFLAVRNKKNDAVNYAVINGQTGKIALELPIDFKKYLVFTLLISIPIFILLNLFLSLTPKTMLVVSIIFSIINIYFALKQSDRLQRHVVHEGDKGFNSVLKEKETNGRVIREGEDDYMRNKFKILILNIISTIICVATFIINPISDLYFYFAAIVSLVMILLSFKDIIGQFNMLTSRRLSPIGIRGGDESEI